MGCGFWDGAESICLLVSPPPLSCAACFVVVHQAHKLAANRRQPPAEIRDRDVGDVLHTADDLEFWYEGQPVDRKHTITSANIHPHNAVNFIFRPPPDLPSDLVWDDRTPRVRWRLVRGAGGGGDAVRRFPRVADAGIHFC